MTCDEYRAARMAGDDSPETEAHSAGCAECRAVESQLARADGTLRGDAVWESPSADLEDRIVASLTDGEAEPALRQPNRWAVLVASWAAAAVVIALVAFAATRPPAADWEVGLVSTDAAPTASATVLGWNEPAGTRLALEIDGLAPAPDGFFYEFWLSDGPIHISAGTFHSPGEIELWAGVSRGDYPRLWITLEPIDEDESPAITVLDTPQDS